MIFKFLSPTAFIVSLALGLLFVYLSNPKPEVILVYPTPENVHQIQYKDKAGTCFEFNANEVKCPKNGTAKKIPLQN